VAAAATPTEELAGDTKAHDGLLKTKMDLGCGKKNASGLALVLPVNTASFGVLSLSVRRAACS